METDEERTRRDFLIAWYEVLWRNIDRSMTGMWQILAPITVVGTALVAIHQQYLPIWIGGSVAIVITIWALNLTIDLNSWHRRNLYLLSGVEREFLRDEDYGKLIPEKYRQPTQTWINFYCVHGFTFSALLIVAVIDLFALAYQRQEACWTWVTFVLLLVGGIGFAGWHLYRDFRSSQQMRTELAPTKESAKT